MSVTKLSTADIRAQAEAEIRKEKGEKAKNKLKGILTKIETAKEVVANLEREYEVALAEIEAGA